MGEVIGEGSFGHVYAAKHNRTGKKVAIKKFKNKYQSKKKAFDMREI
jgi:serine/threonine protein kinase